MVVSPAKPKVKLTLRRIRLNRGGYDRLGTYYGIGQPLFDCESVDPYEGVIIGCVLRADNREHARQQVRSKFNFLDVRFFN